MAQPKGRIQRFTRNRYLLFMDAFFIVFSYAFIILMVFDFFRFPALFVEGFRAVIITAVSFGTVFLLFRVYNVYWLYGGSKEYARLFVACMTAAVINLLLDGILMQNTYFFPRFDVAMKFITVFCIFMLRMSARVLYTMRRSSEQQKGKRLLIVGAGQLGAMLLRDLRDNRKLHYQIVGLVDDDRLKQNRMMYGAKVLGKCRDIPKICKEKRVEEIIFAIYSLPAEKKNRILELCTQTGCNVKIMPSVEAALSEGAVVQKMRDIEIEDLLERETITFDSELIKADICGKTVLVTGGGGSIGSELCRQIATFSPKKLIILDIYENTTYELQNELTELYPEQDLEVLIASIRDKKRLEEIFRFYQPDLVFHAAAHKHVPLMEYSPKEAVKNNVFGTLNVARCADKFSVKRFVMISTDKAVNPTNVMGATKRMCEMIIQTMAQNSKTEFVAVRFGNVLGSNGSVIPRFKKQIAAGGPVTVTDPEITRFFMTIPEAVRLVLQAAVNAVGGEIFVLDMGEPVKIYHLAKKMIQLAGYKPDEDIKIVFTGLRPGEKLYEELLMNEEGLKKTQHSKIFIGTPVFLTEEELEEKLDVLNASLLLDDEAVKTALREVVPTYVPNEDAPKAQGITLQEQANCAFVQM